MVNHLSLRLDELDLPLPYHGQGLTQAAPLDVSLLYRRLIQWLEHGWRIMPDTAELKRVSRVSY